MIDSSSIVRSLCLSPSLNFESDRLLGEGIPEDSVQAYAWASIAAAQGQKSDLKKLIAKEMTRAQIAKAQKLAREYWDLHVVPFRSKSQN